MNTKIFLHLGVALFVVPLTFAGQAKQTATPLSSPTVVAMASANLAGPADNDQPVLQHRPRYLVQRSDSISITFPLATEMNQTVTVQPDGYISLLSVGEVHVEGMTVAELREKLKEVYSPILHNPVITVDLKDFQKPSFSAFGQVAKPGTYELREDITVAQAIADAGGFLSSSKHSQVLVFRRVSKDWAEVHKVNMKQMLKAGNLKEDLHIEPDDIVYVPQNAISKIQNIVRYDFVTGSVLGVRP
jgi:polysaccharide biosynthesis/export protein